MQSRIQKVKKILKAEKAGAVLVMNSEGSGQPGTEYLSGFSGSSSVMLVSDKKRILISDGRYTEQAQKEAKGFGVIILKANQSLSEILKQLATKFRLKKILIDGSATSYSAVEKIRKALPSLVVENADGFLKEIRRVKGAQEIALLTKAAKIACRAFLKFLPEVKAGASEKFLAERLDAICKNEGAEKMAFETIVASGGRGALPHARPSDKKLRKGELVVIDWGVKYKGFVSDATRTVAVGKISPRLQKIYEAVRKAQEAGCKKARAGVPARALDSTCRKILRKHSLEKYFTHATGHGIGMEIHELPVISAKNEHQLEVGEVITCEPGVYIKGLGGVRIEDSLVITKNGNINLTGGISKKLFIVDPA